MDHLLDAVSYGFNLIHGIEQYKKEKTMKTFDKKDVYSWSNAEEAKQYIGKKGYFANKFSIIEAMVRSCRNEDQYTLLEIDCDDSLCFCRKIANSTWHQWDSFFLPIDKVKEVEEPKKYRPFKDLQEFKDRLHFISTLGNGVTYRDKNTHTAYEAMITEVFEDDESTFIALGTKMYSLSLLFTEYEWKDSWGNWQPFGVEE